MIVDLEIAPLAFTVRSDTRALNEASIWLKKRHAVSSRRPAAIEFPLTEYPLLVLRSIFDVRPMIFPMWNEVTGDRSISTH